MCLSDHVGNVNVGGQAKSKTVNASDSLRVGM